jgi:hypothetical protein
MAKMTQTLQNKLAQLAQKKGAIGRFAPSA